MIENTTRETMMNVLAGLINPVMRFFHDEYPYISLPSCVATSYSDHIQKIESFARLLWGASFADENVLSWDERKHLINAIANGTNPESNSYWGDLSDFSQLVVEMPPIALFVYRNIEIYNELDIHAQECIARWLYQINTVQVSVNNWQCFIVLVNNFLRLMGRKYSEQSINTALDNIEKMYLSEGWYSDGLTNQRDYYVSFAIHYYLLMYHLYSGNQQRTQKYLDRAILFADSFVYWFSEDGSALPFGRSLTYRFAQMAFWSILAACEVPVNTKRLCKGIVLRNLHWWLNQEVLDQNGLLTLGYAYPNQLFLEYYNAPGSPLWALKGFAFLLIPQEDDFWHEQAVDLPLLDHRRLIRPAKMVISRHKGYPYAFVNGQSAGNAFGHTECKYEKFVYSPHAGFCVSKSYYSLELLAPDCTLAISFDGNVFLSRSHTQAVSNDADKQISVWNPAPNVSIKTIVLPDAPGHIRVHEIKTAVPFTMVDGGFAFPKDHGTTASCSNGTAIMLNGNCASACHSLVGGGEPIIINAVPNCNIQHKQCMIPAIKYHFKTGKYLVIDWFYDGENSVADMEESKNCVFNEGKLRYQGRTIEIENDRSYKRPYPVIEHIRKIKRSIRRIKNSL